MFNFEICFIQNYELSRNADAAFSSGMQRRHHYGLFPYSHFQSYRLKDIG